MNCIIVDDNKLARKAIKSLISQIDFLTLKQECATAMEAFNYLQTEDVDFIFLDVEMPGMSGIELIKNLEKCRTNIPTIILITAKKDYAFEAFELNVADYLVKPVTLSRFIMSVSKAKKRLIDNKNNAMDINEKEEDHIFVRADSMLNKIKLNEITHIQAQGDYVNVYVRKKDKHYSIHCTLKSMEEKLPASKFCRLHRSYMVALNHIDRVDDNKVYVEKNPIPIGKEFKKDLFKKLNLF